MAKDKKQYSCSECGSISPKWAGQCGECSAWNSLIEIVVEGSPAKNGRFAGYTGGAVAQEVQNLSEVVAGDVQRTAIGIGEFDRVLGGGLVPGSVVLLGGDPGIGKSTLLLQVLDRLSSRFKVLYISGEESPEQISMRAQRLSLSAEQIRILAETQVERILRTADKEQPAVLVVDSIQTIFTELLQSAPGSVAQVRESCAQLVRYAKRSGTALFFVGHVTKDGQLAGPRVLEHMVDTVLYFEGDRNHVFRILRAVKNRFGSTNEIGVFEMKEKGLAEVVNPSAVFISERPESASGSAVTASVEGTRPILVELQA
ncbi:MAG: DNA repair protein RadA, partial [Gammaproteobacteria bacterium]|nr:DNA repair protein RadA [Gammaproteobacteria bacterium]